MMGHIVLPWTSMFQRTNANIQTKLTGYLMISRKLNHHVCMPLLVKLDDCRHSDRHLKEGTNFLFPQEH